MSIAVDQAALGQRTRYEYDVLNRLTKTTDMLAGLTQLSYDPNGNLLSVTDPRSSVTSYTYSNMDHVTGRTDPLTRNETFGYDNNGNLTSFTDRKSQVTSITYDALDRSTQVTYASGATTTFTWDGGNRVTQIVDSISGTITRAYDGLDQLTQEVTPQGTVSYTYNAAGRRTSMTVLGQPTVTYTYDNADRLTQITQGTATVSLAYDNANRRTGLTLANGVITDYAYDAASRLTGQTYRVGQTTLGNLTYTYDLAGQRTQLGGTWARTGLPQAVASATYNAANHQLAFGGQTLTYDLNGNLTSDGSTTNTWDSRNRLASLSGPGTTASFQYDPLGRRARKVVNATTTDFLYDGVNPVQELSGGSPVANLLTGLGIDEYFTRTDSAGIRALLTDPAATVQTQYTYEPFGAVAVGGEANGNPYQYTGRENEGNFGLYFYRNRYYSPLLHRFVSEDPVDLSGGINVYVYVDDAPMDFVDPFGLDKESCKVGNYVGTGVGDSAIWWYAQRQAETGEWYYAVGGVFSALWTCESYTQTAFTLGSGGVVSAVKGAGAAGYKLVLWRYPRAGGFGLNLLKNSKRVIGLDWHKIRIGGKTVSLPHIDIPGVVRHWPWASIAKHWPWK